MKTKLKIWQALRMFAIIGFAGLMLYGCRGKDGAPGATGPIGDTGTAGTAGTNGTDGTDANAVSAADQAAYDAASGDNGGLAYNKFYVTETGFPQPASTEITGNSDFFRCKSCHGWDLNGINGSYINRGPTATRPNVSSVNLNYFAGSHNIREIFDAVKHTGGRYKTSVSNLELALNGNMPDYGLIMSDALIWDIVKYLKTETIKHNQLYDLVTTGTYPTGTRVFNDLGKTGNATTGNTYFQSKCSGCHTADGTTITGMPGETVGGILRAEPFEIAHLIKFGMPGEPMMTQPFVGNITDAEIQNLYKALADTVAFP